ncbi:hypothetical protein D5125_02810 [Magnetovirga frankeli]|uniref:hypothetical protein n=1 Tax=Magnetovirga frankeli TaxID=947516 RepID=UPI0012940801|nr:hypothetical protein D5125_02810 [gamma proteobacterium SS-5]
MRNAGQLITEIYGDRWSAIFANYCREKFSHLTDPFQLMEDARQLVALSLERKHQTDSEAQLSDGYVMMAFRNAVTDLNRQLSGRAEPRAWLKAFGRLGQVLFDLYCLAKKGRTEILAELSSDIELATSKIDVSRAGALLDEMDQRQECAGKGRVNQSIHDDEGTVVDIPSHKTPEQELMEIQRAGLQAYLFRQESQVDLEVISHFVARIESLREQLRDRLELDDEQSFILHATLSGELTEQEIGRQLGGLSVRQVRYRRQQALDRMRMLLEKAGIGMDEIIYEESVHFSGHFPDSAPLTDMTND